MSVGGDDYRQAKPIITQHRHHAHAILGRSLAWQANPIRAGAAASAVPASEDRYDNRYGVGYTDPCARRHKASCSRDE